MSKNVKPSRKISGTVNALLKMGVDLQGVEDKLLFILSPEH